MCEDERMEFGSQEVNNSFAGFSHMDIHVELHQQCLAIEPTLVAARKNTRRVQHSFHCKKGDKKMVCSANGLEQIMPSPIPSNYAVKSATHHATILVDQHSRVTFQTFPKFLQCSASHGLLMQMPIRV